MQNVATRDRSTNMTQYEVALHLTSDFIGILYTWWDSLEGSIQITILDRGVSHFISSITLEFIGRWSDVRADAKEKFLNTKLYNLNKFE